jgi:hypothetical protein
MARRFRFNLMNLLSAVLAASVILKVMVSGRVSQIVLLFALIYVGFWLVLFRVVGWLCSDHGPRSREAVSRVLAVPFSVLLLILVGLALTL